MTEIMFNAARERGNAPKLGQLNPTGRYGVAEGASHSLVLRCQDHEKNLRTGGRGLT